MGMRIKRKGPVQETPSVQLGGGPGVVQVDQVDLRQVAPNLTAPSMAPAQMASKSLLDQAKQPLKQPGADQMTPTGPAEQNVRPDEMQQQAAQSGSIISRINKPGSKLASKQTSVQRRVVQ